MAERLFISQAKLEAWIEEGRVTFQDNVLTLLAERVSYNLEPAARILKLIDGEDKAGLLGKAVTVAELTAQNAEHYRDSVILADTAYECEEGFMGTAESTAPAVESAPPPSAAPVVVPTQEPAAIPPAAVATVKPTDDADLLAEFMLKHM